MLVYTTLYVKIHHTLCQHTPYLMSVYTIPYVSIHHTLCQHTPYLISVYTTLYFSTHHSLCQNTPHCMSVNTILMSVYTTPYASKHHIYVSIHNSLCQYTPPFMSVYTTLYFAHTIQTSATIFRPWFSPPFLPSDRGKMPRVSPMPLCLSVRKEQLRSHWTDFHEFCWVFLKKICRENSSFIKIWYE